LSSVTFEEKPKLVKAKSNKVINPTPIIPIVKAKIGLASFNFP